MGVHHDAGIVIYIAPDHVGRLSSHPRQSRQLRKLPAETIEESYDKEYGKDTVQIHKDALDENDVVLLHDDLLATGGTMKAACELVKRLKPKKVYVNFIIELKELNGKSVFGDDVEVESVLTL